MCVSVAMLLLGEIWFGEPLVLPLTLENYPYVSTQCTPARCLQELPERGRGGKAKESPLGTVAFGMTSVLSLHHSLL